MGNSLAHNAVSGAIWATVDKFGSMSMQFIVNLILARLLFPEDFGIIEMLAIFIAVSQTLIDGGFGSALIQKKTPSKKDFSTIFYWNILFSIFLYLILYFFAPLISHFFKMTLLCDVLRVIALSLIINSIITIQRTRLQKELAFKTIAIVNLSSYILGAVTAIILAKNGFGVWSLVAMQLIYGFCSIIILFFKTKWLPSGVFSLTSMKELFGFGGFIMAANILQTICLNIQGLVIGKKFSASQMGYYSQAYKLDQVTSCSIPQVIVQVMYPVFSSLQDEKEKLNNIVLMNMRVIAFIVFPILSVVILLAPILIQFLYGEKWMPSAPYFRILCIGGFFVSLQNINYYAVAAVGKSKTLFKWSICKWSFLLISILIGMDFGMSGILWGMVLSDINIYLINAYLASKHTGLSMRRQLYSIFPVLCVIIVSSIFAYTFLHYYYNILISTSIFICCYVSISCACKLKAISDTKDILKKIIANR